MFTHCKRVNKTETERWFYIDRNTTVRGKRLRACRWMPVYKHLTMSCPVYKHLTMSCPVYKHSDTATMVHRVQFMAQIIVASVSRAASAVDKRRHHVRCVEGARMQGMAQKLLFKILFFTMSNFLPQFKSNDSFLKKKKRKIRNGVSRRTWQISHNRKDRRSDITNGWVNLRARLALPAAFSIPSNSHNSAPLLLSKRNQTT